MLIERYGTAIVKRLERILDKNVNIIDKEGRIIASTDASRVGTLHECGRQCAQSRRIITVTSDMLDRYPGSREGINLPIIYRDELMGVVGITGEPSQVESLGMVIKEVVELMLAEYDRTQDIFQRERAIQSLFEDMVLGRVDLPEDYYGRKSKSLGVPISGHRLAVGEYRRRRDRRGEVDSHQLVSVLQSGAETLFREEKICVLGDWEGHFVLVLRSGGNCIPRLEELGRLLGDKLGLSVRFALSEPCRKPEEYALRYRRLRDVLRLTAGQRGRAVAEESRFGFELLLDSIDRAEALRYMEQYRPILSSSDKRIDSQVIQTLKDFFENDMSVTKTAQASHLHKNTITYRLTKVREAFPGLIDDTYSCMKLYVAIALFEREEGREGGQTL